jgi:protein-tyrosine-phosphatase
VKQLAVQLLKKIRRPLPSGIIKLLSVYRTLDGASRSAFLKQRFVELWPGRRGIPADVSSVLFVCHGNIIRSPMAAALMKRSLSGVDHQIFISSAGLHANPSREADHRALLVAREFGISLEDHRAQQLTSDMIRATDMIFVMDFLNEAELLGRYPWARQKVFLLGTYIKGAQTIEVADPYCGEATDVRCCYETLQTIIHRLAGVLFPPPPDHEKVSSPVERKLDPKVLFLV